MDLQKKLQERFLRYAAVPSQSCEGANVVPSTPGQRKLAELLKDTPCKINLIPWNPFPGAPYGRSSNSWIPCGA